MLTRLRSRLQNIAASDAKSVLLFRDSPPARAQRDRAPTADASDDNEPKQLTGSAQLIAFLVFLLSWRTIRDGNFSFHSLHDFRVVAVAISGLIGSVLLFKRDRRAKHAFLIWAILVGLGLTPWSHAAGSDGDPFWVRVLATLMAGLLLNGVVRTVDENVTEDWEREEFND